MPYRRRRRTIRRYRRRALGARVPRMFNKRRGTTVGPNIIPSITRGVYWFKRTVNNALESASNLSVDGSIVVVHTNNLYVTNNANAAGNTLYGTLTLQFTLANLPGLSDFTSLFDSYQIRKVVVNFIPYQSDAQTVSAPGNATSGWGDFSPIVHYAIDHDGVPPVSTSEAGIGVLQQYVSYKKRRLVNRGGRGFAIVIKPRSQTGLLNAAGAIAGNSETRRNQWIDLAHTDVPHYGLGMVFEAISPGTNNQQVAFRMETTYYLKFKAPR